LILFYFNKSFVHHPKLFPTKTTHMHKYQKDQHYELGQNV